MPLFALILQIAAGINDGNFVNCTNFAFQVLFSLAFMFQVLVSLKQQFFSAADDFFFEKVWDKIGNVFDVSYQIK